MQVRSRSFLAAAVTAGLVASSLAGAHNAVAAGQREPSTGPAGRHVSGDFDGDGLRDLVAGAPGGNVVRVVYSHARVSGSYQVALKPNATNYPGSGSMDFGSTLAVGDFNHDGFADLAVSAPRYTTAPNSCCTGQGTVQPRGAVFIFMGSRTGLHERPLTLIGPYDGDNSFGLGGSMAVTDVNADGYADLAMTVDDALTDNVLVYDGSSNGLHKNVKSAYTAGDPSSIAFGDVNGDGHPDLIVGDGYDYGKPNDYTWASVVVFDGTRHGISAASPQVIHGAKINLISGSVEVASGDIDADRHADVAVAGQDSNQARVTIVFYGGSNGLSVAHRRTLSQTSIFGPAKDGGGYTQSMLIGRVRGTRFGDVLIGAPSASVNGRDAAGEVVVLRGSSNGVLLSHAQRITQATPHVPGSASAGAEFGLELSLQNVSTGHPTLVIGAPGSNYRARRGGMVVSLRGTSTGVTARGARSLGDTTAHDGLGTSVD